MKKTVRISESQLNNVIKKVIREQNDAQVMSTGPSAEQMAGTPETDDGAKGGQEPDFEQFKTCAKTLLDQGITIGNLVDQLLDAEKGEGDGETEEEPTPDTESGVEPEAPMAEAKKARKVAK